MICKLLECLRKSYECKELHEVYSQNYEYIIIELLWPIHILFLCTIVHMTSCASGVVLQIKMSV